MRSAGVKVLLAAGTAAVVATGVAGCGAAQELSAKETVDKAVSGLAEARTGTFTISLDSTVADLQKLEAAESGDSSTSAATLQRLLDGDVTVTLTAPEDKSLADVASTQQQSSDFNSLLNDPATLETYLKAQGSSAVSVRLKGSRLVEFRSVGTTIYARADVPTVLELTQQDPSAVDAVVSQLPPSLAPVAKAAKGEWLAVDLVEAARSLKSSGMLERLPTSELPATTDPAAITSLLQSLRGAYDTNAEITTVAEDGERGTQYRVTAPAKQVALAIENDLVAVAGKESAEEVRRAVADVPDRDVAVDLWVKDDELRAVSLDLGQFAEKPGMANVALDIAVELDGDEVSAPDDANTLVVSEALLGLGSVMTGGMAVAPDAMG